MREDATNYKGFKTGLYDCTICGEALCMNGDCSNLDCITNSKESSTMNNFTYNSNESATTSNNDITK